MNLWGEREKAIAALDGQLSVEAGFVDRAFQQLEYLAQVLAAHKATTPFSRVTGLVTAKGRHLAVGTWSLMLDSLGQECGAIARVWLEAIELLVYLHQKPSRVEEFLDERLPSAGARAKAVAGSMQPLRDFWNTSANHLGTDPNTWLHAFSIRDFGLKTRFSFSPVVLRRNMGFLFALLHWNIRESAMCLNEAQGSISESIAIQIDSLGDDGFNLFHGPAPDPISRSSAQVRHEDEQAS